MKTIGVLRLSSLGDTVLITPVLRELKARFPESHITTIVKDKYAPVFHHNPNVDKCIVMYTDGVHNGLNGLRRFVRELRRDEYDVFIDLHRNLRSRMITSRVRAKQRMWYKKRRWRRSAMVHAHWFRLEPRHTVDLYFDCLHPLGIEPKDKRPEIYLTEDEIVRAKTRLASQGIFDTRYLVGIHIGAKSEVKRWFPDRFARVADALTERGWTPLFLGGEGDRQFLSDISSAADVRPPMLAQLPLRDLLAVLDQCAVLLCHDSGPMHVAVARGVPVVALFGPTHPKLGFWPLGDHDVVLTANEKCSPCSLHGTKRCRRSQRECLERITVDQVFDAVLNLVEKKMEAVEVEV